MSNYRIELYSNGELLDMYGDKKLVSQIPIKDKTVSVTLFYCRISRVTNTTTSYVEIFK